MRGRLPSYICPTFLGHTPGSPTFWASPSCTFCLSYIVLRTCGLLLAWAGASFPVLLSLACPVVLFYNTITTSRSLSTTVSTFAAVCCIISFLCLVNLLRLQCLLSQSLILRTIGRTWPPRSRTRLRLQFLLPPVSSMCLLM